MGDVFKKVQPGQRLEFTAEAYNAFLDAARAHKADRHNRLSDYADQFRQATIIRVQNGAGKGLKRFSVLAYDDPIVGPDANLQQFQNQANLKGVVPTDPTRRFCVLLEPLADNAIGRVVAAGVTPVQVNVLRESDRFAEIDPDETDQLRSSKSGPAAILWKESGTGVKWAIVLLWSDEPLIPFELVQRADSLDDFPADAYRVKPDGSIDASQTIKVAAEPILGNIYGPAEIGFRGWASGSMEGDAHSIIHMQRFARYITFTASFGGTCEGVATVGEYWDGEDPSGWQVRVRVDWMDCQCLETETGIAILDESASLYPYLRYKVVSLDQIVNMANIDECATGGYSCVGDPIRTLLIGKGLTLLDGSCQGQTCTQVLQADMLEVVGSACDGTETQKLGVQTLYVESPLKMEAGDPSECLGTATLSLPTGLIKSDCLDVQYDAADCAYDVNLPAGLVKAGAGIAVAAGACDYTVSATNLGNGIAEGDCISFDVNGNTTTINSTVEVTGGNGVIVNKSGCTFRVSLDGSQGDPLTTLQYLCDVEITQAPIQIACVEGSGGTLFQVSGGEITVTKSYGTVSLPSAMIAAQTSDCGGSGSSGGDPPIYTCDDCPDCAAGEAKIIKDDGTECDCITDSASMPEGWSECGTYSGAGGGITWGDLNCGHWQPYVDFRFDGMPDGAVSYEIEVQASTMPGLTIGPSYDHEESVGQWYHGALCEGWICTVPQGEQFTFTVVFRDASGNIVRQDEPVVMTCP